MTDLILTEAIAITIVLFALYVIHENKIQGVIWEYGFRINNSVDTVLLYSNGYNGHPDV